LVTIDDHLPNVEPAVCTALRDDVAFLNHPAVSGPSIVGYPRADPSNVAAVEDCPCGRRRFTRAISIAERIEDHHAFDHSADSEKATVAIVSLPDRLVETTG
jgi:hypothetical protein